MPNLWSVFYNLQGNDTQQKGFLVKFENIDLLLGQELYFYFFMQMSLNRQMYWKISEVFNP